MQSTTAGCGGRLGKRGTQASGSRTREPAEQDDHAPRRASAKRGQRGVRRGLPERDGSQARSSGRAPRPARRKTAEHGFTVEKGERRGAGGPQRSVPTEALRPLGVHARLSSARNDTAMPPKSPERVESPQPPPARAADPGPAQVAAAGAPSTRRTPSANRFSVTRGHQSTQGGGRREPKAARKAPPGDASGARKGRGRNTQASRHKGRAPLRARRGWQAQRVPTVGRGHRAILCDPRCPTHPSSGGGSGAIRARQSARGDTRRHAAGTLRPTPATARNTQPPGARRGATAACEPRGHAAGRQGR